MIINFSKNSIKEFFSFSRSEIRGLAVLSLLIVFLIIVNIYLKYRDNKLEIRVFEKNEIKENHYTDIPASIKNEEAENIQPFDPNTASIEKLMAAGLSRKSGQNLVKYREKGGKLYNINDLYKIYGIDSTTLKKLSPYISIKITKPIFQTIGNNLYEPSNIIELNTVDTTQLVSIKGLGNVLSKRILNYRQILGGFNSVNQLKEVYGINDSLYNKISKHFEADKKLIKPLNINNCTYTELSRHPYITNYQANAILAYKKLSGSIKDKKELLDNFILPPETFSKVAPYLVIE